MSFNTFTGLSSLGERLDHLRISPDPTETDTQWRLPFDTILDIAAFRAGAFNLKTFLNVSLCCHEVYDTLKPVLKVPIVQWDAAAIHDLAAIRQSFESTAPLSRTSTQGRRYYLA
jgi:hypothetical protein